MTLGFATSLRDAWLTAINTAIGASGKVRIYSGTRPATGGAATTLLAELPLSATAGTLVSQVLVMNAITDDVSVDTDGVATWFRALTSADVAVFDGNVGGIGSGEDLILTNVNLVQGGTVGISSFAITAPNP